MNCCQVWNLSTTWNLYASFGLAETLYGVRFAGQFTNFTSKLGHFGWDDVIYVKCTQGRLVCKRESLMTFDLLDVCSFVQLQFVVIANLFLKVILHKYEDFKMKLDLNVDQICINLRCSAWLQCRSSSSRVQQHNKSHCVGSWSLHWEVAVEAAAPVETGKLFSFSRGFSGSTRRIKNYSLSPEPWFPYTNTLPDYFTSGDPWREKKKRREKTRLGS